MRRAVPELRLSGGRLDLAWPDRSAALRDLRAVCRVHGRAGLVEHTGAAWRRVAEGYRARCGPLELTLTSRSARGAIVLGYTAAARQAVRCREVGVLGTPELAGEPPRWLAHNGYQSWDAAGVLALPSEGRRTSWWTCGLADAAGGGIALAARAAARHLSRFDAAGRTVEWLHVAAPGAQTDAWQAEAGDRMSSEEVTVSAGADVLAEIARLARRPRPRRRQAQGWLSWYHFGPWVSAEELLENSARVAAGVVPGITNPVIQLDDGWQMAYGDWRPNTRFRDLGSVCDALRDRGQTAGIWTAPFLVSVSSDLDANAPEGWFVRDQKSGARLVDDRHTVFGPMHVLDARVPAVRAHLERVFAQLRADGFGYFKIDFLYAGAYAGVDALRAGVRAVRRGCGRDTYVVACGAPLLPMAGLVDGCRIGPDTCTPLFDPEAGGARPTIFGDEIQHVARNIAARARLDGWFDIDPDVAMAGGNLTPGQARQLLTAVALCGGLYFLGDDLATLDPQRLELLANPELPRIVGGGPAVPDWQPEDRDLPPAVWRQADGVVAVFNWTGQTRHHRLGAARSASARDLWTGQALAARGDVFEVTVEPGDVRLLRLDEGSGEGRL